jgi:hypothetical protein
VPVWHLLRLSHVSLFLVAVTVTAACGSSTKTTDPAAVEAGLTRSFAHEFRTDKPKPTLRTGCISRGERMFLCSVVLEVPGQIDLQFLFNTTCDARSCVYRGRSSSTRATAKVYGFFRLPK